jgi:small subunit ribosomal protein S15
MLSKTVKQTIISETQAHKNDTGSAQVQIAVLSKRIQELTDHLKTNKKDHASRRGLLQMVSQRRRLLSYLSTHEPTVYAKLIKKLGLKR